MSGSVEGVGRADGAGGLNLRVRPRLRLRLPRLPTGLKLPRLGEAHPRLHGLSLSPPPPPQVLMLALASLSIGLVS